MSKQKYLLLTLFISYIAMTMFVPVFATAGELESTAPPGPTRHTLDENHDKPEEVNNTIDLPTGALVEKTGQTKPYETGDDGDLEKGVAWPNPRFADNGDGTVTDKLTGLIWLKNANCFGKRTWSQALSDFNGLKDLEVGSDCDLSDGSRVGDWRLPNVKELQSLVNYGRYSPPLPSGHPFDNVQFTYYWSSTSIASGVPRAWGVEMYLGSVGFYPKDSADVYVWPVRGRQ